MAHQKGNISELLEYILFLEERIAKARKQGEETHVLVQNRTDALQQIHRLQQASSEKAAQPSPVKANL